MKPSIYTVAFSKCLLHKVLHTALASVSVTYPLDIVRRRVGGDPYLTQTHRLLSQREFGKVSQQTSTYLFLPPQLHSDGTHTNRSKVL